MDRKPLIYLIAGESSGDLHGAALVEALFAKAPCRFHGVAGPRLRARGVTSTTHMEELQIMGFTDVVRNLPKIIRLFCRVRAEILRLKPDAVVFIDYPGFNLRLARSLKRCTTLIHYICPSVWAWGKKRIFQMARSLDLLLTLFPFEPPLFEHTRLPTRYVGHPLVSQIPPHNTLRKPLLALFPGSRPGEIERNLPLQLAAARHLQSLDPSLQIAISLAHPSHRPLLASLTDLPLVEDRLALMRTARLALAKSGTVTLELALCNTPTVVQYVVKPIDLFLAKYIFRILLPHYCIANIVAKREIFPELIGPRLTEDALKAHAETLWFDESAREKCRQGCIEIRALLGPQNASEQAAEQILSLLLNTR